MKDLNLELACQKKMRKASGVRIFVLFLLSALSALVVYLFRTEPIAILAAVVLMFCVLLLVLAATYYSEYSTKIELVNDIIKGDISYDTVFDQNGSYRVDNGDYSEKD